MTFRSRKNHALCCVCDEVQGRYFCSTCSLPYCSVACYKTHKAPGQSCSDVTKTSGSHSERASTISPATELSLSKDNTDPNASNPPQYEDNDRDPPHDIPLKPLTSLKWPYIAESEEPAYPDPLERNDPKPLRTKHYEAIATSREVRKALFTPSAVPGQPDQPNVALRALLGYIDKQSGSEREQTIRRALGADREGKAEFNSNMRDDSEGPVTVESSAALSALAKAIEDAIVGCQ
ncbi:hypothetical protein F5878DRAFT_622465 [Lentinula raphanica]|uniref:HIT-type domain-containing protein n=1 Tax=Lentinula raphanica TaxID=153919 RepID=A0AA38UDN4_9AGAR|nr:hypothetical protein F5878DRAFT_622465 [Lentinula raphanica]